MEKKPVLITITGTNGSNAEMLMNALVENNLFNEMKKFSVEQERKGCTTIDRRTFEKRLERGDVLSYNDSGDVITGYRRQDLDDALLDDRAVAIVSCGDVNKLRNHFVEEQAYRMYNVFVTDSSRTLKKRLAETMSEEGVKGGIESNEIINVLALGINFDHEILSLNEDNLHEEVQKMMEALDV